MGEELVHELIAAQAARFPDRIAIGLGDREVSYGELDRRSNQLASRLRDLGIARDQLVVICLERSYELVIAILGVLKAGGAFVPIDPTYPRDRLAWMVRDAGAAVLLTTTAGHDQLGQPEVRTVLCDHELRAVDNEPSACPDVQIAAGDLAYMIYTSGTTGRPKGVLVEHRGVVNNLAAMNDAYFVDRESRVLQFASPGVDAALPEILGPLICGGRVEIAAREHLRPGMSLLHLLEQRAITTVTFTPSLLGVLPARDLPQLRTIISAGEACDARIVATWGADRRLVNAYGPTEATICASTELCRPGEVPTIGRALPNVSLHIVDEDLEPVPAGTEGELWIGGVGVARGYHRLAELTAERFVRRPFAGGRLYRTGDRCVQLDDGRFQYIGRADNQVKIRGFRVELGEIEHALREYPDVRSVAVVARADGSSGTRLAAYYALDPASTLTEEQLRSSLAETLPPHMVPSSFVRLRELPRSANGKVDRAALSDDRMPETSTEPIRRLEDIIRTVLGSPVIELDRTGMLDELPGWDSLAFLRIVLEIERVFGIDFRPDELGEVERVGELEELIDDKLRARSI